MRTRMFLLAIALLVPAFAGCAEEQAPPTTTTPTGGTTPTTTSPEPTPTSPTVQVDATPTISSILVGTEAAYPPFEDKDVATEEIFGFDIDVMTEIGNRSGFTVEFQDSAFQTIIPSVVSGQFQAGASAFTITDERKEQVDFTVPYYDNRLLVAVAADDTTITSEEDLRGVKVCTQTGTTSETYLRETLGHTNDTLLLLGSAPPCADAVKRGDAAALMIDAAFVRNVVESSNGELKEAFEAIETDEQFGFVVAKGNVELLTAMNAALVSMKQDGTLDEIADKWQV